MRLASPPSAVTAPTKHRPAGPADDAGNASVAWPPASIRPAEAGRPKRAARPLRQATSRPAASRATSGSRAKRPERAARRWQLAGALVAIVAVVAVVTAVATLRHDAAGQHTGARGAAAGSAGGSADSGSQLLAAERKARTEAVSWLAGQVSRNAIVSCDPVVCADLAASGFPASSLLVLKPTAPDPGGSDVIVATAGLRSQFGSRLTGTFAPEVLASFGSGQARIDVRVVASDGTAAYRAALSADVAARQHTGAELARDSAVAASPAARQQLIAGQVDSRLLSDLNFLSKYRTVDIVAFGSAAPGASAGLPLRSADLIEIDPAARLSSAAYVHALTALLQQQQPPFRPASISTVALASGERVLRIEFPAPSPLGLLGRTGH